MIDINNLLKNPEFYRQELIKRNKSPKLVDEIVDTDGNYKIKLSELESYRTQKNEFNSIVINLNETQKEIKTKEMKLVSEKIKNLEPVVAELKAKLDLIIRGVPNILWEGVPLGKNDDDNPVIELFGVKPEFDFEPKPYWELEVYKKYIGGQEGVNTMGSRGYYMKGELARFQKVLFDYIQDIILQNGYELFYVPLMLNDKVLTGTGHLPDFDGQQYEVKIDENKSFYLIGSSEPSIMGYFMNKNIGDLKRPILATCQTSCFRKEAGSYGKDQQGILRVHQFEKIEMVVICRPEHAQECFEKNAYINETIRNSLGLHFRKVEVCSGDMPGKHYRQQDYEGWFPAVGKFRELGSNGNASDYQNRGLNIIYTDDKGNKVIPWGLNDTGVTFRTGLAIMEQFQDVNGRVRIPDVLIQRFGKEWLE